MAFVTLLRLATFPVTFLVCTACAPDLEVTARSEASGGLTHLTSTGGISVGGTTNATKATTNSGGATHATEATTNSGGTTNATEPTSNGGNTNAGGSKGTEASTAATSSVWFDSSNAIRVETSWAFYTWGSNGLNTTTSGSRCWAITRADMSAAQLASLAELTLVAGGTDWTECWVDGYRLYELTVIDSNGTISQYLDTTCSTFNTTGATTKVPSRFFESDSLALATMPSCPQ